MTAGQQAAVCGDGNPVSLFTSKTIHYHDPYTGAAQTQVWFDIAADGTYQDRIFGNAPGTGTHSYGLIVSPGTAIGSVQVHAAVVAGAATYLAGTLNTWIMAGGASWAVTLVPTGAPYSGQVILRMTLRNAYSGIIIGNAADINFDVIRYN
jgi:hypothetical protein